MKKTLVKIGSVLIVTALMSAVTMAEEKTAAADNSGSNVKKLEAMGAARARLQQTLQEVMSLADGGVSGYSANTGEIARNYEKTYPLLDKAIQKEQTRPEAERNAERLQAMNNERQNVAQLWSKYANVDRPAFDSKLAAAYQRCVAGLNPVCASLNAMDSGWTKLNLDMDQLKAMFESVEKSALEIKAQQQAALAEVEAQATVWRNALASATNHYATWTGESEAVAK